MKAVQRAFGRLRIEGACGYVMRREIVEHGAGDRRLADAAFVRTHHDHCWLRHGRPLADAAPSHTRPVGLRNPAENSGKIEGVAPSFPRFGSTHPACCLEARRSARFYLCASASAR